MAHKIDTIVLDKTGTVTAGKPQRHARRRRTAVSTEDEVLRLAASAERYSEHPLGKAIVEAAPRAGPRAGRGHRASSPRPATACARGWRAAKWWWAARARR